MPAFLPADPARRPGSPTEQKKAIAHSENVGDYVSRELFESILESEEDHIDWLETNIGLIDKVGLHNYLQSQMGEAASS